MEQKKDFFKTNLLNKKFFYVILSLYNIISVLSFYLGTYISFKKMDKFLLLFNNLDYKVIKILEMISFVMIYIIKILTIPICIFVSLNFLIYFIGILIFFKNRNKEKNKELWLKILFSINLIMFIIKNLITFCIAIFGLKIKLNFFIPFDFRTFLSTLFLFLFSNIIPILNIVILLYLTINLLKNKKT